jgi:poly(3-hydroxybutyrate) depolymerase
MEIRPRARVLLLLAAGLALAPGTARTEETPEVRRQTLTSAGRPRTYWLSVPVQVAPGPRPLLVLLHGSGKTGEAVVRPWKELADKEGIVLAGPDSADSVHWSTPTDGPGLLRDVVEAAAAVTPIDRRRVYLFGHSAGAGFAFEMGALESEYFAAVAIHAGALPPDEFATFDWARRKIPYAIWIGTKDAFFPVAEVRATRDALASRGFPVQLTEMPGHTHDYTGSAKEINRACWEFLKSHALSTDPKFASYGESR